MKSWSLRNHPWCAYTSTHTNSLAPHIRKATRTKSTCLSHAVREEVDYVRYFLAFLAGFCELLLIRMRACTSAEELLRLSGGQCVEWGGPGSSHTWVLLVIKATVCQMATAVPGTVLGTFVFTQVIFTTYDGCKAALLTSSPAALPSTCSALATLAFLLFLLHTMCMYSQLKTFKPAVLSACKVLPQACFLISIKSVLKCHFPVQSFLTIPSKTTTSPTTTSLSVFLPFIIRPDSIF